MVNPEHTLVAHEPDGRWTKGASPNPGGRAKGFASYIRERTNDGQELVDFVLSVMRGAEIDAEKPGLKVRMQAAQWLSDRGFGRPVQGVVHAEMGKGLLERSIELFEDVSTEDIRVLVDASRALQAKAKVIEMKVTP